MDAIAKTYDATIHNCALGNEQTYLPIIVRPNIAESSFFEEYGRRADDTSISDVSSRYTVKVERFDTLFVNFARPSLCKIDVQGAEKSVIQGMERVASEIDILVVELNTIATLIGSADATETIGLLTEFGFTLYDILAMNRRPLDGALAQIDLAFVRHDSPLRSDRRWSA